MQDVADAERQPECRLGLPGTHHRVPQRFRGQLRDVAMGLQAGSPARSDRRGRSRPRPRMHRSIGPWRSSSALILAHSRNGSVGSESKEM